MKAENSFKTECSKSEVKNKSQYDIANDDDSDNKSHKKKKIKISDCHHGNL